MQYVHCTTTSPFEFLLVTADCRWSCLFKNTEMLHQLHQLHDTHTHPAEIVKVHFVSIGNVSPLADVQNIWTAVAKVKLGSWEKIIPRNEMLLFRRWKRSPGET